MTPRRDWTRETSTLEASGEPGDAETLGGSTLPVSNAGVLYWGGERQTPEGCAMDLKELPAELARFVEQALASGTYPSAGELVVEAVRVLQEREARQEGLQQRHGGPLDTSPQTPEEYVRAMIHALATGDPIRARTLAREGAERYPQHMELHTWAHVLAPPTAKAVPATPESRAAVKANNAWLQAHEEAYRGSWIALRGGQLLYASPSFDDVIAHVGDVRGRGILLTKILA